jgi:glutathione S-transferase
VTPRRDDRRKFIVGEHLTLTYITYIPFYTRRERYTVEIGDNYPNLKRWGES